MKHTKQLILGLGGTMRANSSSERALNYCLDAVRSAGMEAASVNGLAMDLPMYSPQSIKTSSKAAHLVDLFRRCDGLIISSPSYHGGISGMLKNALDYAEELNNQSQLYFDGRAIGMIACGAGLQGAVQALNGLRSVAHALRGWPTPLGAVLNTSNQLFADDGSCSEPGIALQLATVSQQVVEFTRLRARLKPAAAAQARTA